MLALSGCVHARPTSGLSPSAASVTPTSSIAGWWYASDPVLTNGVDTKGAHEQQFVLSRIEVVPDGSLRVYWGNKAGEMVEDDSWRQAGGGAIAVRSDVASNPPSGVYQFDATSSGLKLTWVSGDPWLLGGSDVRSLDLTRTSTSFEPPDVQSSGGP
jgi:hypothetical protein